MNNEQDRFILEPERRKQTGISAPTAWRMEKRGEFPKRRKLSEGRVGWFQSEINDWKASRQVTA